MLQIERWLSPTSSSCLLSDSGDIGSVFHGLLCYIICILFSPNTRFVQVLICTYFPNWHNFTKDHLELQWSVWENFDMNEIIHLRYIWDQQKKEKFKKETKSCEEIHCPVCQKERLPCIIHETTVFRFYTSGINTYQLVDWMTWWNNQETELFKSVLKTLFLLDIYVLRCVFLHLSLLFSLQKEENKPFTVMVI